MKWIQCSVILLFLVTSVQASAYSEQTGEKNIIKNTFLNPGFNITVETDKNYYYPEEIVNFNGRLTENGTGFIGKVEFTLKRPNGDVCMQGFHTTTSGGYFSVSYPLQINQMLGLYNFTVWFQDDPTVITHTIFEVRASYHIEKITGGMNNVYAEISNDCGRDVHNISWSITVRSPLLSLIYATSDGKISTLQANTTETLALDQFMLGFGPIRIDVSAQNVLEYANTKEGKGFIIIIFIICR